MTRKFTFLLMALLALTGLKGWGQENITVQIGTDVENQYSDNYPFYSYYKYSYNQMLYKQTEIGAAGIINSISFHADYDSQSGSRTYSFDIYMKNVDREDFSSWSDWESVTAADKVGSGTIASSTTGWVEFTLLTPFYYDGTSNLMIAIDNNTGSYGHKFFYYTYTVENLAHMVYNDNTNFDPLNPPTSGYNGGVHTFRPNIKLNITPGQLTPYNITYDQTIQHGSITGPATAFAGQTVTLTAMPDTDYALDHFTVDGEPIVGNTFTMPENNVTVSATFKRVYTLTVNDGTDVYSRAPFYGGGAYSYYTKSQFVIPASYMEDMQGGKISQLKFYLNVSSYYYSEYSNDTWDVYVKELDDPSGDWWDFYDFGTMTKVYSGSISIVNNELTITFNEPFQYNDKSLMIGFNQTQTGFNGMTYWLGSNNTTGSAGGSRCRAGWQNGEQKETKPFLPKTTFTYEQSGPRYTVIVNQPEVGGTISADPMANVAPETTVTLSANPAFGYEFGTWTVMAGEDPVTVTNNTFEMPESDVTVTATFNELTQYNITCSQTTGGAIHAEYNGETITSAPAGTVVTLVAEPNTGYAFGGWTVMAGETPVTVNTNNTFEMPGAAVTVSATFSTTYTVEIPTLTGGTITHMSTTPGQTAYAAGTDVFFIPSPEDGYEFVEYSIVVKQWDPINETWSIPVAVDYNSGMPRITMPAGNVQVSATFRRNKFNVTSQTIPAIGGSFQVSPTSLVAETAIVSITNITPNNGYQFASVTVTRNDTQASVTVSPYSDYYVFNMPNSDVTVTVTFKALPRYSVSLGTMQNGTVTVDEPYENILAGTTVYLEANPATGYTLESITVTPEEGESFEPTQQNSYYYFTMPSSNVTISATFRLLQSYTINYYVNGKLDRTMQCYEDRFVNNEGPQTIAVPAGMTFEGWGVAEIGTYTTEKPAVLGNAEKPTQNYNLYAVLRYTESVPATSKDGETWKKLTSASDLKDGDEIVFVYEFDDTHNYVMTKRHGQYNGYFDSQLVDISNNEIVSLPSNATTFTAKEYSGNWKFQYEDEYTYGETTLGDYYWSNQHNLAPMNLWEGIDTWNVVDYWGSYVAQNTEYTNNYVGGELVNNSFTYKATDLNPATIYKKSASVITTNYYMTSVLTGGTVADATVKNIIVVNPITVSGRLEMNAEGLFRNENAAKFVFEDGAQLITDNTGVLATMKKNITGTDWYTISSPLAESVGFTEVENLIPSSGVTGKDYDLYRFDEANSIWVNSRVWQNNEPNTTIIANPNFKTIDKGLGYIYANNAGADHIAFAGKVNVADVENVNLTKTADKGKGFNLIGNPFMQNIELANVTGVTLADGFYVLSNDGDWRAKITDRDIKPLQGFLVQATEEGGTARISKNASVRGERSKEQSTSIEMIVSNSNHRDNAYAMFGEGIGLNKINHRNAEAPMLYIPQGGEDFAIAFMDESTTLFPLNFKAMTTGKYSISLKATDDINTLVLVDNMTGIETNMLLESSYSFIGSPADKENRFTVKLGISHNDNDENEQFVYQYGNELIIDGEGTLQVFDVLGRVVISEEVHGQRVDVSHLTKGAYIVRMTGNEVKTQKIIVR